MNRIQCPDLVIFDCDGVLVDSEPISLSVLLEAFGNAGAAVSQETGYRQFLGKSLKANIAWVEETFQVSVTDSHLDDMRAKLFQRFRADLRPVSSVSEALAKLKCPVCVASSSQPERIALSLKLTGLTSFFGPHVFSATMVARGKPAPDLFIHAAESMGVSPDKCVVVEDSPAGIQAAHSAGMPVIGFAGASHAEPAGLASLIRAERPTKIISDMAELPSLLQSGP